MRKEKLTKTGSKGRAGKTVAGVLIAIAFLWMIFGITVSARARQEREEMNRNYLLQEKRLIGEVRSALAEMGYRNSGVTMGRIVYEDDTMEYRLTIHHGKISALGDEERQELLEELSRFTFEDEMGRKYHFAVRFA